MHCSKFAGAAQHFLLLLQKKTLAKEKEPEGISISPQTPLNRPEKPLRFFWTFPAIAENPMRIRTTLWTFSAGYFAANIQTQLLANPLSRIRRRVAETRKVTTEWNAKLKYWCLPEFRCRKHQTHPSTLFSPIFSLAREKIGPPEARQKRPRRNEALHARLLILCARFFLSKPQTEFAVWAFPCRSATTSQPASLTAPLEGEPRGAHCRRHRAVANLQQPLSLGCAEPAPLEGEPFVWLRGPPLRRGLRPSWGWRAQRRGG